MRCAFTTAGKDAAGSKDFDTLHHAARFFRKVVNEADYFIGEGRILADFAQQGQARSARSIDKGPPFGAAVGLPGGFERYPNRNPDTRCHHGAEQEIEHVKGAWKTGRTKQKNAEAGERGADAVGSGEPDHVGNGRVAPPTSIEAEASGRPEPWSGPR